MMGKKRMNNLGDLKQIKFKKEKEDIYSLPYQKNEPPKEKVNPESDPEAEEIFMAAMQGVQRMDGSSGRKVAPAVASGPAQPLEDDAANDMDRFMRGDIEFELEYTDEFMYGYVRGLDIKIFQRLKAGSLSVAAHLDLHGMTSDQARDSLLFFIRESYLQGHRCVLVVTGRGRNSPGGRPILRYRGRELADQGTAAARGPGLLHGPAQARRGPARSTCCCASRRKPKARSAGTR